MKTQLGVLLTTVFLAIAGVSSAHEQTAPWLDESALDGGLYVEVRHPHVIRRVGPFDVTVVVNNLDGPKDVALREIRYTLPGAFAPVRHPREVALPTRRAAFRGYKAVQKELHEAGASEDEAAVSRLSARSESLLRSITRGSRRDRQRVEASFVPEVGSTLSLTVEIDVVEPSGPRTLRRVVDILVAPPLPSGPDGSWFAGDQHLHTLFSNRCILPARNRRGRRRLRPRRPDGRPRLDHRLRPHQIKKHIKIEESGKDEVDILMEMAVERVRCPLLLTRKACRSL